MRSNAIACHFQSNCEMVLRMKILQSIFVTMLLLVVPTLHAIPVRDVANPWVTRGDYVEDQGQVVGAEYSALINAISQQLKDKTTDELMVVTVDTLDGMTVEDYAEQLFKQFGIGQKGKDNGALILLARDDRKVRIEVGYGLEGVLNDAKAGRFLDEHAVPYLKDNQFGRGLYETAKAVAGTLALAASVDMPITDPVAWPVQPEVQLGATQTPTTPMGKAEQVLTMAIFATLALMPLMLFVKMILYSRRQTLKGRKEALTQVGGLSAAAFVLPPASTIMVGYSEGVLWIGLLVALLPISVDVAVWFALRWFARRVDRWHPQCAACQQAMRFVKTETSGTTVGTSTDVWRCAGCNAEQKFSDKIYMSRGGTGWSYSRPSSGSRSSGGGSSGGGGASRSF